ncbi:guanylate cyclase 32E-like [Sarcoptes scabiei]|nr:guanylate cyclase 32E-like [Sarcoptes scabiei]
MEVAKNLILSIAISLMHFSLILSWLSEILFSSVKNFKKQKKIHLYCLSLRLRLYTQIDAAFPLFALRAYLMIKKEFAIDVLMSVNSRKQTMTIENLDGNDEAIEKLE